MAKRFVRTTHSVWESKTAEQKAAYNDSIVFVDCGESGKIWTNGQYYSQAAEVVKIEGYGTFLKNDDLYPTIQLTSNQLSDDCTQIILWRPGPPLSNVYDEGVTSVSIVIGNSVVGYGNRVIHKGATLYKMDPSKLILDYYIFLWTGGSSIQLLLDPTSNTTTEEASGTSILQLEVDSAAYELYAETIFINCPNMPSNIELGTIATLKITADIDDAEDSATENGGISFPMQIGNTTVGYKNVYESGGEICSFGQLGFRYGTFPLIIYKDDGAWHVLGNAPARKVSPVYGYPVTNTDYSVLACGPRKQIIESRIKFNPTGNKITLPSNTYIGSTKIDSAISKMENNVEGLTTHINSHFINAALGVYVVTPVQKKVNTSVLGEQWLLNTSMPDDSLAEVGLMLVQIPNVTNTPPSASLTNYSIKLFYKNSTTYYYPITRNGECWYPVYDGLSVDDFVLLQFDSDHFEVMAVFPKMISTSYPHIPATLERFARTSTDIPAVYIKAPAGTILATDKVAFARYITGTTRPVKLNSAGIKLEDDNSKDPRKYRGWIRPRLRKGDLSTRPYFPDGTNAGRIVMTKSHTSNGFDYWKLSLNGSLDIAEELAYAGQLLSQDRPITLTKRILGLSVMRGNTQLTDWIPFRIMYNYDLDLHYFSRT